MANQSYPTWQDRTVRLIGEGGVNKLRTSSVLVIGVGGVGGYVTEMLVRAGVGHITIVDFDTVAESNLNRQIIATISTIGAKKVDVLKDRILSINPNCVVDKFAEKFDSSTCDQIFTNHYDYVVDAIDMVTSKVLLAKLCKDKNIPLISAMGAGNRYHIPYFEVMDIFKTQNDGLARIMRKKLREEHIDSLTVVCSKEIAQPIEDRVIGSISYYPCMCGCVIAAYVINELLK